MCRDILNISHTYGQTLDTQHPIDNNDVEGLIVLTSSLDPLVPANCINILLHLICIAALPPCGPETGLPVLICEENCLLYQQIQEAGLCDAVEERFEVLKVVASSQDFEVITRAFLEFNCSDPATFLFMNVTNADSNMCTSIFSPDAESE